MHPNARKCIRLLTRAAISRFLLTVSFVAPAVLQFDCTFVVAGRAPGSDKWKRGGANGHRPFCAEGKP